MASKVLVPPPPFTKLQVKKSPSSEQGAQGGFLISGDAAGRVAHLEHSVRFLQEQHRLMLSGLHAEIEALRERNRDLQFQLIFNKESPSRSLSSSLDETIESNEEAQLKREITRLEKEAAAARGEARAAEARALQLHRIVDAQAEKLRQLEISPTKNEEKDGSSETSAELRLRLADAERLVRRLRADAERQRREVQGGHGAGAGVTNLLFDGALATHAHNRNKLFKINVPELEPDERWVPLSTSYSLQCMKNSLHASLRASGMDAGYGFQNNYFPSVHAPEFWREPLRDEYSVNGAGGGNRGCRSRRPVTLPELAGQQIHRSTVYANHHTRPRANGYENKPKKQQSGSGDNGAGSKSPDEVSEASRLKPLKDKRILDSKASSPELNMVVTQILAPTANAAASSGQNVENATRQRPRRHHRKHADHT